MITSETIMADDKSKRGKADRSRVAGSEVYEVRDFAGKHGLTVKQVEKLIEKFGNDRVKLDKEAEKISKK